MGRANAGTGLAGSAWLLAASAALAQDQCQPEWSGLNGGADWFAQVRALDTFDEDAQGPQRAVSFAGGGFHVFAGQTLYCLARWDGWRASGVGLGLGEDNNTEGPFALRTSQDHGLLPAGLYIAGAFYAGGGIPLHGLARWDGRDWYDVGGGLTSPLAVYGRAMCVYDKDGDGPLPPYLYVGGQFQFAGGVPAVGLARWDGQTWSAVGGGLDTGNPNTHPTVYSLGVFDDGRGPALYVGGSFYYAGGKKAYNIARWDGQDWESVGGIGGGLDSVVHALTVYDEDGPGPGKPALFAGGSFSHAVGIPDEIWHIARWDGQNWSPVGGWISDGSVFAAAVWKSPDDQRDNLYIGGFFNTLPDHKPIGGIARWDGQSWREVDYGVGGFGQGTEVDALAPFDEDGDGPNPGGLYVGGMFLEAGGVQTHHIARWGCPLGPRCDADLDRNGTLDLFDFLAFINLYNAEDPSADCDGSGTLDIFDFLCFVNAFNAGC